VRGMKLNIAGYIKSSRANGPGNRSVIFFQGCPFRCRGCFNQHLQAVEEKQLIYPEDLLREISENNRIEGITVSGGEPFLQPESLFELLKKAKERYACSTVVYTGYLFEEIDKNFHPYLDVLIDEKFEKDLMEHQMIRGSTNQRFIFLSDRYSEKDMKRKGDMEIIVQADGTVLITGFPKGEKNVAFYQNPD